MTFSLERIGHDRMPKTSPLMNRCQIRYMSGIFFRWRNNYGLLQHRFCDHTILKLNSWKVIAMTTQLFSDKTKCRLSVKQNHLLTDSSNKKQIYLFGKMMPCTKYITLARWENSNYNKSIGNHLVTSLLVLWSNRFVSWDKLYAKLRRKFTLVTWMTNDDGRSHLLPLSWSVSYLQAFFLFLRNNVTFRLQVSFKFIARAQQTSWSWNGPQYMDPLRWIRTFYFTGIARWAQVLCKVVQKSTYFK